MIGPTNAVYDVSDALQPPTISLSEYILTIMDNSIGNATKGFKIYADGVLIAAIPIR